MRLLAALALSLLVGLPVRAQIVSDNLPGRAPTPESVRGDLVERYRPFLAGLYSEGTLASGPVVGTPALYGSATVEGGYRFDSGDAIALVTSLRTPLGPGLADGRPELTGSFGVQGAFALRRFSPSALARRAELGVGVGVAFYGDDTVGAVEITPRVAIPLTPILSLPVGVRVSQPLGDGRSPYLGLSVGLRRIWADEARMVLE